MYTVAELYAATLGGIFVLLICRLPRGMSFLLASYAHRSPRVSSLRRVLVATLMYHMSHYGFYRWLPPPFHLICIFLHWAGTGACNVVGVGSLQQAGRRAAHLALINLIPLFFSSGYEFGSRLLGVTLETYGVIHRTFGVMAVIEGVVHVVIATQTETITTAHDSHFYGIVAASLFLALALLPLVKKRVYELFLWTHRGCAVVALWSLWLHTRTPLRYGPWWCLLACVILFVASATLQTMRILFRNVRSRQRLTSLTMHKYGERIICVVLRPPRPWVVRAGERVELSVPRISMFSLFQKHPFTVSWWEEDAAGRAREIFILLRPRAGFTGKLTERLEYGREYRAWIDGPFGPAFIGSFANKMGDFGHVFMVTTGIGIATQLPYIKELIAGNAQASVCTQRISLVWQLEQTGDWESARGWLQALVKQDHGYLLNVSVYDHLRPAIEGETTHVGDHNLVKVYGGVPNWGEIFFSEIQKQAGRMLISVSASRVIRQKFLIFAKREVGRDIELVEQEFQPWSGRRSRWTYFKP